MGAAVVRVAGQLSERVVRDHDIGAELSQVVDDLANGLVERYVDEPGPAGGGRGVAGIGVTEHARPAGAERAQSVGEFSRAGTVRRPCGRDDRRAGTRRGAPCEHATGQQGLVVGMREHAHQRGGETVRAAAGGRVDAARHVLCPATTVSAGASGPVRRMPRPGQPRTSREAGFSSTSPGGRWSSGVPAGWTLMDG